MNKYVNDYSNNNNTKMFNPKNKIFFLAFDVKNFFFFFFFVAQIFIKFIDKIEFEGFVNVRYMDKIVVDVLFDVFFFDFDDDIFVKDVLLHLNENKKFFLFLYIEYLKLYMNLLILV